MSAYQGNTLITVTTSSTLDRGLFVSGAGTLSATLPPVGVSYDADGTDCIVAISGTVLVKAAGSITAGAPLKSDSTGKATAATVGTDHVAAIALEAASAGELFKARLI